MLDGLLSRLERVRQTGPGRWIACCPAHDDKSPSLTIRELEDGRILVHCFTGCSTAAVLAAVGLEFADLYPERPPTDIYTKPERRPFPASDVLRALYYETLIVAAVAGSMQRGDPLDEADATRLALAQQRIGSAISYVDGGRHHG